MNFKAAIALSLVSLTVLASAQDQKPLGFSARIGAFLPTDSAAQSVGNAWLAGGLDFDLHSFTSTGAIGTSSLELSIDYSYRESYRQLPGIINYVYRKGPMYFLGGIGANFSRSPNSSGGSTDKTRFAYDLGVGYDVLKNGGVPIFVEGRFVGNEESTFNGFGVFVGVRL